jgi:hypothetical protein
VSASSNRERLLRLIDGGHDALKEAEEQKAAETAAKSAEPAEKKTDAGRTFADWLSRLPLSNRDILRLAKLAVLFGVILAVLHYGVEALKTMRRGERAAAPAVIAGTGPVLTEEESAIGLRLVGVDSSQPPVALIEDLRTGKTFFVRKNEQVRGARVKEIAKNRVLVSVDGRNVELR